jgi:integrase
LEPTSDFNSPLLEASRPTCPIASSHVRLARPSLHLDGRELLPRDAYCPLLKAGQEKSDSVQINRSGQAMAGRTLSETFSRFRDDAGLLDITFHTLRHSCASIALTSGVDVMTLAARLGDAIQAVLRVYAHFLPSGDRQRLVLTRSWGRAG